jgi:hypothetical protein
VLDEKLRVLEEHQPDVLEKEMVEYLLECEQLRKQQLPVHEWDILGWWKAQAGKFPALAMLARQYMAVPSSSADSERVFSHAGILNAPKRTRLDSKVLGMRAAMRFTSLQRGSLRRVGQPAAASQGGQATQG